MRAFFAIGLAVGLLFAGPVETSEKLSEAEALALNNFHHEMVDCLVYFGIAEEGIRRRGNEKTAAGYRKTIELLFARTFALTQKLGMKKEAFEARMQMSTNSHVNGGAKLVHPGGAKLVHLTLCGTRCWGVVPVVHRRDPRCFE